MVLGMRGICYVELSVETAAVDVHSGLGGSIFPNAAWRLVWALNTIKGPDGKVRIAGFYDAIEPPSARDLELLQALPEVADEYRRRFGVNEFLNGMEADLEIKVAEVFTPSATICGLTSGYQGAGSKTVQPARASAKLDFRLVSGQDPEDIFRKLRAHLDAEGFQDVHARFIGGTRPARTDPDDPFIQMVMDTALDLYEHPMRVAPQIGGSGPNHAFIHHLGVPIATSGIGYPGSNAHAPNENIRIDLYLQGARHAARILQAFGKMD
jgi:acetylornithine deacetylase/succinyl-diaminopimelate desuccinylase-like protein